MSAANTIITGALTENWQVTWTLTGALTVPADNTYTDGYNLKFQGTTVAAVAATTHKNVCVQYLDAAGAALAATDTAQGAPFVCLQALSGAAGG